MQLRSPYPWFGGKGKVAPLIWRRFGVVRNYVEPFLGSAAVLLQRPQPFDGPETVNDLDGMVSNFWRALQADPQAVAEHADWPVNECDLHARHLWLVNEGRRHVERLKTEPEYFDAKIAGWWVWGCCQWIGSGWCEHPEWKQRPHLGDAGMGIHRPSQQLPHLGDAGRGEERGYGHPSAKSETPGTLPVNQELRDYLSLLSERFSRVRVCCGDWSRVCGPTPTVKQGLTAVFLDPPYDQTQRDASLYAIEDNVSAAVREWCKDNGHDKRLRIALCGYAGEGHEELESCGWAVEHWKARGGYGSQGDGTEGRANSARERIWFSPYCEFEAGLFDALGDAAHD
jgi:site-specific DNA-adenine methylase